MTLAQTNCIPQRRRLNLISHIRIWIALAHQRRALANLTAAQRADIGVTAQEAETEANRAIWDVPAHWRY